MTVETTENIEEKIETIGAFLKQVRTKKNISINKVADDLCIRKIYIQAIEENNHKELPPVPYGVGFVRSYAAYLGLNVERVVQLYKDETDTGEDKMEIFEIQNEITYPSKQYIVGGIIAALVIYLLYAIISGIFGGRADEQIPVVVVEEETEINDAEAREANELKAAAVKKVEKEAETAEKLKQEEELKPEEKKIEPVVQEQTQETIEVRSAARVVVRIKDETWMQVKGPAKTYIAKIVGKGFVYEVPNEKGIVLTVGRPYNADIYIDGKLKVFTTERKPINVNVDEYLSKKNH